MRFTSRLFVLIFLCACQNAPRSGYNIQGDTTTSPGWVSVFQTMTSDTDTSINILRPRLANMVYAVEPYEPGVDYKWDPNKVMAPQKTTKSDKIHWSVDRIHVKNLKPGVTYRLAIVNKWRKKAVDWRLFKTLEVNKKDAKFIVGSCMSDSHAFEHVRNKIWDRMLTHDADFIMLLGDQLYVDDFDFVARQKATEFDLWTRYIDSFRKIPLFQNRKLIPIFAVWDDHDFGTNNSDRTFKLKKTAKKVFQAFFGGENIKNHVQFSGSGVGFSFSGFGQKFVLMDTRYYKDPNGKNAYSLWGKKQHQWMLNQLKDSTDPLWLANGVQFFAQATVVTRKDGSKKQVNETFMDDNPGHFKQLMKDLKKSARPVVFLSGDIHYSEIAEVEPSLLGYKTYEITSSPIHSYIFRSKGPEESWLKNPRRIMSVKEHNYLVIDSKRTGDKLNLRIESFGVKQEPPYFSAGLSVEKRKPTKKTQQKNNFDALHLKEK